LTHIADATRALARGESIIILGSSSLLASFPELGDAGGLLETSFDVDLLVEPYDQEIGKLLDESIGENSVFHGKTGYYAHVMLPATKDTLPRGWEKRLVPLPGCDAAHCLDPHDLAAVKLQVGRSKDLELCAALLATNRLDLDLIRERLAATRMDDRLRVLTTKRLKKVIEMAKRK
jgi:hypothetical protein